MISNDENQVIEWMIGYYCAAKHGTSEICDECSDLLNYAIKRINNCPHGENKPVCSKCKIHCYKESYRNMIREVMKFSGPKVIFKKPVFGIKYLIKKYFR